MLVALETCHPPEAVLQYHNRGCDHIGQPSFHVLTLETYAYNNLCTHFVPGKSKTTKWQQLCYMQYVIEWAKSVRKPRAKDKQA